MKITTLKELIHILLLSTFIYSCDQNKIDNKNEESDSQSINELINLSIDQKLTKEETLKLLEDKFSKEYITIQPGERGIIYYTFEGGLDLTKTYSHGEHLVSPWNQMIIYNINKQKLSQTVEVLDVSGMHCSLDIEVIFIPIPDEIGYLHEKTGLGYSYLIESKIREFTRSVIGEYVYYDIIYSEEYKKIISDRIQQFMEDNLKQDHIQVHDVWIDFKTDPNIEKRLQELMKSEKEALKFKIQIDKERIENEKINLKINKSDDTKITSDASDKVIVIGNGDDDLPIILEKDY